MSPSSSPGIRCRAQGIYSYATGYLYDGEWENDEKNGRGRQTFTGVPGGVGEPETVVTAASMGDSYEGQWKDGNHHGEGEIRRVV